MPVVHEKRTRDLGILSLAVIAPIWGYSWVVSKVALDYAKPFTFIALITASCAVCLFLVLLATRRSLRPPPLGWTVAIGLLQTTLFNSLATLALSVGGAGKVSVLVYTMTFWLMLLAWFFLGERLHGLQWPAVALAFAGLVLVVRPWDIGGALSGILAGAAGLAWAGGALLVKLLQRRAQVDALSLTTWQMTFGALPLITVALVTQSGWPDWTGAFVLCLAYSALLSNALCWGLWIFALRALPAGAAAMGTLAVPVVGVVASWIQLGERPTALEAAGMTLIIAALALLAAYGVHAGSRAAGASGGAGAIPPVID
jgi:drug/metabolite transporter (DMT)-like permease